MIQHTSSVRVGCAVSFPEWEGQRAYMVPFSPAVALPAHLERFQPTVDAMLTGTGVSGDQTCYIMVDESEVSPGGFHRRPGMHVDGYWHPDMQCHGGGGGGRHSFYPGRHGSTPGGHVNLPPAPHPAPAAPKPAKGKTSLRKPRVRASELVVLASNHSAARAYVGVYDRDFASRWEGGDCSDVNVDQLRELRLHAGRAYHLDVFTLHESMRIAEAVRRTVVRINVPGVRL